MGIDRRSLDGLSVLGAVVEAGSFVRAGEALGLTQSAVSRAVARLEDRIGVRLFRRTARSISLTDEGRRFYASVAPHLAAIVDATTEAGGTSSRVRGRLRVNVDGGIGQFVLTPRLQPFLAQHPDLAVEIAVRDRMGDLVRDGFDVSVRFGLPEPSALKCRLLMHTRVVTCASPAYVERHGMPRRPRDIEKHQCVLMRDPSTGTHFGWEFARGKKVVPVNVTGQLMVNEIGSHVLPPGASSPSSRRVSAGRESRRCSSSTRAISWPSDGSFKCSRSGPRKRIPFTRTITPHDSSRPTFAPFWNSSLR